MDAGEEQAASQEEVKAEENAAEAQKQDSPKVVAEPDSPAKGEVADAVEPETVAAAVDNSPAKDEAAAANKDDSPAKDEASAAVDQAA